jgi:hypothetical protein
VGEEREPRIISSVVRGWVGRPAKLGQQQSSGDLAHGSLHVLHLFKFLEHPRHLFAL